MKTNLLKTLIGSGLALAVTIGVWSPMFTSAEQIKGAQGLLTKPAGAPVTEVAPAMACGKCKTEFVSRVDTTARGANKPVIAVATHGCGSCDTVVNTVGVGKNATQVGTHSCDMASINGKGCCK